MKDFTISLEDRPGTLADLCETLGNANVNIEGICGIPCEGKGYIHIIVEDHETTKQALEEAGFEIEAERDILILDISTIAGIPGTGAEVSRKLANAGVNINLIYMAENNRVVIGVDNLEKALSVI
ncbi:MAG: ACT domain-containing protein [Candidatus Hodarchaeota archaeon]